jgi:hypothetical protein
MERSKDTNHFYSPTLFSHPPTTSHTPSGAVLVALSNTALFLCRVLRTLPLTPPPIELRYCHQLLLSAPNNFIVLLYQLFYCSLVYPGGTLDSLANIVHKPMSGRDVRKKSSFSFARNLELLPSTIWRGSMMIASEKPQFK